MMEGRGTEAEQRNAPSGSLVAEAADTTLRVIFHLTLEVLMWTTVQYCSIHLQK